MNNFIINGKFLTQSLTGVQRYAAEITRHLASINSNFSVITSHGKIQEGIITDKQILRTGQKANPFWEQFTLPGYLKKKQQPLLLNLCNTAPVLYKNKIVCIHDISFIRNPSWFSTSFYTYYKLVIPLIIKSSRHIITVSNFSKMEIMDYYKLPADKISVVTGGVSSLLNYKNSQDSNPATFTKPFFLFVGSIDPRKNLLTLLKAFVQSGITNTALFIVGASNKSFNKSKTSELSQYHNRPNIHFLQKVNDQQLHSLYKNARALIVPSFYEGFGLPVIEALSLGCPVIASDIPVFREVAEGLVNYFDPFRVDELELLLHEAAINVPPPVNIATIDYTQNKYNWITSCNKLIGIINIYQ